MVNIDNSNSYKVNNLSLLNCDNEKECFCIRLSTLRKKRGYKNLNEFEEASKISRNSMAKWEAGKSIPSVESLMHLCNALSCDADYLLGRQEYETKEITDICAATGLSENAVKKLKKMKAPVSYEVDEEYIQLLNKYGNEELVKKYKDSTNKLKKLSELDYKMTEEIEKSIYGKVISKPPEKQERNWKSNIYSFFIEHGDDVTLLMNEVKNCRIKAAFDFDDVLPRNVPIIKKAYEEAKEWVMPTKRAVLTDELRENFEHELVLAYKHGEYEATSETEVISDANTYIESLFILDNEKVKLWIINDSLMDIVKAMLPESEV